jgi:hypothetical protein
MFCILARCLYKPARRCISYSVNASRTDHSVFEKKVFVLLVKAPAVTRAAMQSGYFSAGYNTDNYRKNRLGSE